MRPIRNTGRWRYALALALVAPAALAQPDRIEIGDRELARLGIVLGAAERVEEIEVATGPGEVVVPPGQQALVAAPVGGSVARMLVAEGEAVSAGQPIAELDSAELLELERAFVAAHSAAELAAAQAARDRGLHADGIIAERRVQESGAAASAARAALDQARARLELAGFEAEQLERLATGRALEPRLTVRAPIAGVVARVHADVGTRLDALDPVLALADLGTLWVELRLAEHNAARVAAGMPVAADVGTERIGGTVTTVGRVVDRVTQTVLVRAEIDGGDAAAQLRAGQFLVTRVLARPPGGAAHAVPTGALTRHGGQPYVFVRNRDGFAAVPVTVLAEAGGRVYVEERFDGEIAVEGIGALKALWLGGEEDG